MKKVLFFLSFFVFVFAFIANAQNKKIFTSLEEVREAQNIGTSDFYEPMYFTGHKNLGEDERITSYPYPVFIQMDVVGGKFWVVQKPGTQFVEANGQLIRRWDCGNKIHDFFIPPQETILSQETKNPSPVGEKPLYSSPQKKVKTKVRWAPPIENKNSSWISNNLEWIIGVAILVGGIILYLSQYHSSNQIGPGVTTEGAGPGVQTLSINIGFSFGK